MLIKTSNSDTPSQSSRTMGHPESFSKPSSQSSNAGTGLEGQKSLGWLHGRENMSPLGGTMTFHERYGSLLRHITRGNAISHWHAPQESTNGSTPGDNTSWNTRESPSKHGCTTARTT